MPGRPPSPIRSGLKDSEATHGQSFALSPTGVGKPPLAQTACRIHVVGTKSARAQIDMSEYTVRNGT